MCSGWPLDPPVGNSASVPVVVRRPIRSPTRSVNHMFPSGPPTMPVGELPAIVVALAGSVGAPPVVMFPIR